MFEISDEERQEFQDCARIKVMGIGGGGCNAVNTMIKSNLTGVEYIVANTDSQALSVNLAPTKIQLGIEITKGLGAGANPEIGRKAALDEYESLSKILEGADMVFLTAGMGGGTGTGAAPIIAKLCKELNILTVGVVTKPFLFEGKKRSRQAEEGISNLEENVDSLITIPNQRLLYIAGESLSLVDTFKKADEVLFNAVKGIADLINNTGHINADFADVATVMANKGFSLMGTGVASGSDRAIKAAAEAISSPLLEDISVDGATGIIINITGNSSLTMHETNEAVTLIMEAADNEAEIIFGTVIDENMQEDIKITVIATGLGGEGKVSASKNNTQLQETYDDFEEKVNSKDDKKPNILNNSQENLSSNSNELASSDEEIKKPLISSDTKHFSEEPEQYSLINSVKKASDVYNTIRSKENVSSKKPFEIGVQETSTRQAKSIAEKLGFINFDEEELDTPTFLRKDEDKEGKLKREGNIKSVEL